MLKKYYSSQNIYEHSFTDCVQKVLFIFIKSVAQKVYFFQSIPSTVAIKYLNLLVLPTHLSSLSSSIPVPRPGLLLLHPHHCPTAAGPPQGKGPGPQQWALWVCHKGAYSGLPLSQCVCLQAAAAVAWAAVASSPADRGIYNPHTDSTRQQGTAAQAQLGTHLSGVAMTGGYCWNYYPGPLSSF